MTSKDEESKKEESHLLLGNCLKSITGKHKWIIKEGHFVCEFCEAFTTRQILLD